ncbi:hypothetical protein KVR01_010823 [Diaporthe batatas]|uniref:uncharacterized protein n=1 Tax=Diaporthe batatas TaxID=748121 RepID=UPI001D046D5B|nr:uncharacterized protein KVR01_010823 [Diaporthe batatas]KAG8159162.1 hypothetical protein KVR01_010823 [Diaporthe batatas]
MAFYTAILGTIILGCCLQLLRTRYRAHLKSIPGPFTASISNLWKLRAVYAEDMPGWNIAVHEKFGPVVRIGPNHVSFSSPAAFQAIYTARQAFPKSNFYEVGAPTYADEPLENLFSLRDVQRHATLKRNIGGLYTRTAVKDFEPNIDRCVSLFLGQLAERTKPNGHVTLDMSLWLHLYAFDCLSAVNLSKPLGFLESGQDVKSMIGSADQIFVLVGLFTQAPALQWLLGRLRSLSPAEESEPALKLTLEEVETRRKSFEKQTDMLSRFLDLHRESPDKVSVREIIAAIFINLTAGHDVLAITLRAIWYYLARNPRVLKKLRSEIETVSTECPPGSVVTYSTASGLEYLNAVIQETLRIHPNTGTIIERKVPGKGTLIDGHYIPGGTIVGVNAWVLHRSEEVFGKDVNEFRPERWLEATQEERLEMNRNLFSFGAGAHSCIGKNTAMIMLTKLVFEFYRRYDAALACPKQEWKVHGSWVTKQTQMDMTVYKL